MEKSNIIMISTNLFDENERDFRITLFLFFAKKNFSFCLYDRMEKTIALPSYVNKDAIKKIIEHLNKKIITYQINDIWRVETIADRSENVEIKSAAKKLVSLMKADFDESRTEKKVYDALLSIYLTEVQKEN